MNEKARPATPEEIELELQRCEKEYKKSYKERCYLPALKDGYKDHYCEICGQTILACHHFVLCERSDCPMKTTLKL